MSTEKRAKFLKLANKRVTLALDKIRLIANLSDKRYYEYSVSDSKKIISALTLELQSLKRKFHDKKKDKGTSFELK